MKYNKSMLGLGQASGKCHQGEKVHKTGTSFELRSDLK